MSVFTIDSDKCNSCGICFEECPRRIILIKEPEALPSLVEGGEERCADCGHCVVVCPTGALYHRAMKPEECAPIIRKLLPSAEQVEHLLKSRRSIRAYKEKPVERETLVNLIDIARYAPSGHNAQPVQWLVVEDREEVKRLGGLVADWMRSILKAVPSLADTLHFDILVRDWDRGIDRLIRGAPHLIVAHAHPLAGLPQVDCHIALTYLELAAYSMGLGACWDGYFMLGAVSYPPLMEALRLPEGNQVYGAMMVGHPKYRYRRIPLKKEPTIVWR